MPQPDTNASVRAEDLSRFAGAWTLNPAKTTVSFRTKAMWVVPVKGTAKALRGDARITPDGDVRGTLVIDAASFDTKIKKRDDHVRSADFLEADTYPAITFTADSGRAAGSGGFEVTGVLTAHGQSRPLTLHAEVTGAGDSATVAIETEIDRSQWGMSLTTLGAALKTQVAVRAHFDQA